jgi:hypothetical protein
MRARSVFSRATPALSSGARSAFAALCLHAAASSAVVSRTAVSLAALSPSVVSILVAAPAAAADNQATNSTDLAKQRFREATEAYNEGRYSAAASLFDAADRLAPHPSTRYNAATAWEQAGEAARAATGYEAAIAVASLDEARRKVAEERLTALKEGLGRVRVELPLGAFVTVDHVQHVPLPTTFYLLPGNYQLSVDYQGKERQTPLAVVAGEEQDVKLDYPASEPEAPTLPADALKPLPPAVPPADVWLTQKTWGWIGVGAGVALGGAATVLGLRALAARERFVASGNTDADAHDEASDLRLATNIAWAGATVAGVTGLVLVLTAPTLEF